MPRTSSPSPEILEKADQSFKLRRSHLFRYLDKTWATIQVAHILCFWGLTLSASPGHDPPILQALTESDFTERPDISQELVIRASDIDWNMHVNNVCYLEWALEAVPPRFGLQNKISELDMSFVAEGMHGHTIMAECLEPRDGCPHYLHKFRDKESGKLLALLKISWQRDDSTPVAGT